MKQLIVNDRSTRAFFEDYVSTLRIGMWIKNNLNFFLMACNITPNEEHSIRVGVVDQETIILSGDEDRIEVKIETIESINPLSVV